jgi:hypothetical protein
MRTSQSPRLTQLSERRKGYLLVSGAALKRPNHRIVIQRQPPSLNLPEESCPIFLLPLASRSERAFNSHPGTALR